MNLCLRTLLCWTLLLLLSGNATALTRSNRSDTELQQAWQGYLQRGAERYPQIEFPFQDCFTSAAQKYQLPVTLLLAVARGESDFDPRARSSANAHGLMQILWPTTARELGFKHLSELYDPCRNVDAGARYLGQLLKRYDNNLHLALAAYNYGPGRIRPGADKLPDGARWYSAYILRHLDYVLARSGDAEVETPARSYASEAKLLLIAFNRPYRAQAFVATMERLAPQARLDWFRLDADRYEVVLLHADSKELEQAVGALRNAGFSVNRS